MLVTTFLADPTGGFSSLFYFSVQRSVGVGGCVILLGNIESERLFTDHVGGNMTAHVWLMSTKSIYDTVIILSRISNEIDSDQ